MAKAKKRRAKKRQAVNRAERIEATPETLAKLRACPLKAMLHRGALDPRDPAGMQPDQYEAALAIWDAQDSLTRQQKAGTMDLAKVVGAHGEIGDRKDHLIAVYLEWSVEVMRRYMLQSSVVVGWIDDSDPAARLANDAQRRMLRLACDLWIKMRDDHEKRRRAEAD